MTDLVPVLAVVVPALPLVGALLALLARTPRQADRLAVAAALADRCRGAGLAAIALARGGQPALRGQWYLIDGASGVLLGGDRGRRTLQRAASRPPTCERSGTAAGSTAARSRSLVLRRALPLLGGAAGGADRRQPRRRLAAGRGDDRGVGAARRVQRPARRARGRLEVPRAHHARPVGRTARHRRARDQPANVGPPRPARARLARAAGRRARAAHGTRRWSRSCCCSPASRPRSAGRRCTTGCPTRTARRRRRSARCCRRRCCRACCWSPGA